MKSFFALLVVLLLAAFVTHFTAWNADDGAARAALNIGLLMLGAWLAGKAFDQYNLPKISGYILFGVALGPFALDLIPKKAQGDLQFVNDLAVALIALTAGGEIKLDWLRGKLAKLLSIIGIDVLAIMVLGGGAMYLMSDWIPFLQGETAKTVFFVSLVAATVMIANSPTVVIAMISDYKASGPLTQMTLAFTVCKDLVLIILFATVIAVSKGMLDEQTALSATFLVGVAVQLLGSIALGALLGAVMALYVYRINAHLPFFIIGACMLFALLGEQYFAVAGQKIHLEPLLMALSAGILMQNIWPHKTEPLFHTIESVSLPVYCLFFAIAGAKVNLGVFAEAWYIALGLVAVRGFAIWLGLSVGTRVVGMREPWANKLWLGMIPQAGVTLVLITLVERAFVDFGWGAELAALLLGMLVVHELIGPFGFRHALFSTGEAKPQEPDDKRPDYAGRIIGDADGVHLASLPGAPRTDPPVIDSGWRGTPRERGEVN